MRKQGSAGKFAVCAISLLTAIPVLAGSPPIEKGETAFVDFGVPAGRIKAMHGVNNAPIRLAREGGRQDEFARAGIPFVRTHDTCAGFGGARYVDIPNIFPDFDADETKAENYDFAFTDEFLKPVVAAGSKVFYRLGVTIENHAWIKNYHAKPPKDFAKWARICEHVIRHYNEGWADGFRWGIEYWEIWNECEGSMMWDGTREQFFELYRISANHLKKCFPQIKIGGYGSCGYYHVDDPENRVRSFGPGKGKCKRFVDWFEAFCAYVTDPKTAAPLDFHSWHFYWNNEVMDYSRIQTHAKYVRDTLDRFGLTKCESVMNEWNLRVNGYDGMKGMIGASFCADMFCLMQDSSIDLAMYYDATPTRSYCGLFAPPENLTTPCFEAFVAWNELYRLGGAVKTERKTPKIGVAAATDGAAKAFLLVNGYERTRLVKPDVRGVGTNVEFTVYRLGGKDLQLHAIGTWRVGEEIEIPKLGLALVTSDYKGPRQILIAGDSILEQRLGATSYGSWGQQLAPFLKPGVVIDNLAISGRSSRSFVSCGDWEKLLMRIRKGDYVIISFGHNDVASDANRKTTLEEFAQFHERFVDDVLARGGHPVLCSPTQNRRFDGKGVFTPSPYVGERADVIRAVAEKRGVDFVDLSAITKRELETVGCDGSRCYYMIQRIGNFDNQHTTRWGARRFAELFAEAVKSSGSPFAELFVGGRQKPKVQAVN